MENHKKKIRHPRKVSVGDLVNNLSIQDVRESWVPDRNFSGMTWLFIVLLAFVPRLTRAADDYGFDLRLSLSNRIALKSNLLDTEGSFSRVYREFLREPLEVYQSFHNLSFDKDELGHSIFFAMGFDWSLGSIFSAHLSMDSGEIKFRPLVSYHPSPLCEGTNVDARCGVTANGRPIETEGQETWFVRELYLEAGFGSGQWLSLRAGKMLVDVGSGFVMDNYSLGGMLSADLEMGYGLPWRLELGATLPAGDFTAKGKHSPLLVLDLAYTFSFLEEIGLFFSWYHDGDDSLGEIYRSTIEDLLGWYNMQDVKVGSRGDIFWLGLRANWIFARATLSLTGIIEFGSFDASIEATNPFTDRRFTHNGRSESLGGMFDGSLHFDLSDQITAGCFFLFLSGETDTERTESQQSRYSSFISVFPYITRTNLFFSGGMNQNFSARHFASAGINGRGVLAPGLTLGMSITEDMSIRAVSALLFSHGAHPISASRFYGWENNLNFKWFVSKQLRLLFELDHLWTGAFFDFPKPLEKVVASRVYTEEPSAWKILVGIDLFF